MDGEREPIKKLKMRKTWRGTFSSPTGFQISEIYCRRCVQYKNPKDFQVSKDIVLDKNGMMSVCKTCCEEIYQDNLRSERDVRKALLKTCRTLNWVYFEGAMNGAMEKVKNSEKDIPFIVSYWGLVQSSAGLGDKTTLGSILTFTEPLVSDFIPKEFIEDEVSQDTIDFWGEGYDKEDYRFMEFHFMNFRKTHKIETHTEVVLCQEVVYELLKNKKIRMSGGDVDAKRLESLTKSLGVNPGQTSASQSSKAMDTFSAFIKQIEETSPAEYYKDKKLFQDFDGLEWYFDRFVRRPIKNFFGLSRDFNISDDSSEYDEFENDEDGKMVEEIMNKTRDNNSETV